MQAPKPYREERPWGEFIEFTKNTLSTVKIITVKAGEEFSLQTHAKRDEFWHTISGSGLVTIADKTFPINKGDNNFVPRETKHRIKAGDENVVILEISFGEFSEEDITRFDDKYGRTTKLIT